MQSRGVSVQAFVDSDGTIIQTNDLVDRMLHGSASNDTAIGFEIVNYMQSAPGMAEPAGQEAPFSNSWHSTDYLPPCERSSKRW